VTIDKNGLLRDAEGNLFNHDDDCIFILNENNEILISKHNKQDEFHHSSLSAGKDVKFAGEIFVKNGKIVELTNKSGHYEPPSRIFTQLKGILKNLGIDTEAVNLIFKSILFFTNGL